MSKLILTHEVTGLGDRVQVCNHCVITDATIADDVNVGPFAGGTKVTLPSGALMLDYRQGTIVYRKGTQVRARRIATGVDSLLRVIAVKPWQTMPFATDAGGTTWADGRNVGYRSGPLG